MSANGENESPAERALTAATPVVLLRGPAAAGKTDAALDVYRRCADEAMPRCLLLAPNAAGAARLRRRLLESSPAGVLICPQVATFAELGALVLAGANRTSRLLGALQRHLLIGRLVRELGDDGELRALGAVADTPGLTVTLDRAIAELKRAAIEPDDLAAAVGAVTDRRADLLEIYGRYQQHLQSSDAYDVEGQMWQARDELRAAGDGAMPGLDGVDVVAVDGFTDFTPTQLEILELLARRVDRVVITLTVGDDDRDRMWHWTRRTLGRIRERFGERLTEIALASTAQGGLAGRVFLPDAEAPDVPEGLSLVAAAGPEAEVAAIARRVKGLLIDGADAGSIAVLARSMETYRPTVDRVFAAHEIPVAPEPIPLTEAPVVRYVLRAAAVPAGGYAFTDVLRLIKNSYFRPAALGDYDAGTVAVAEMLIREGNVLAGRDAYAQAAQRLARRPARAAEEPDDDVELSLGPLTARPDALGDAAEMLGALFDALDDSGDVESLSGLLDALGVDTAARAGDDPAAAARDLRALAALRDAIGQAGETGCSIAQFAQSLATVSCPPPRSESLVEVMDVLDARAMRFEHVLLLGVNEREFPHRFADGSLISESDRASWSQSGLAVDRRGDLTAREMLLFYLAVTRADQTLTLSYQIADAAGSPRAPSAFLLSLVEPLGGLDAPGVRAITEHIPQGQFFPPADQLAVPTDALTVGVAGVLSGEPVPSALAASVRRRGEHIPRAARGAFTAGRRWRPGECDRFDGRITDPQLLERLGERYPREVIFSASQLNAFGQCPWQFFAQRILKLSPLVEPQRRLEAETRGIFCHNVLFETFTRLAEHTGRPVRLPDVHEQTMLDALETAAARQSEAVEARQPPYPALWRIQRDEMVSQIREYLLWWRTEDPLSAESLHFELAFATETRRGELGDPAGTPEPLTLQTPAGELRIRGKIDRVDRVQFDDAPALLVVDYKTGALPSAKDIREGRNLQLPIYAAAASRILGESCLGGVFHRIASTDDRKERFFAAVTRHGKSYRANGGYDAELDAVLDQIGRFVLAIQAGRFDLLPTHDCPSYCPYRQVCCYSPARSEFKTPAEVSE